MSTSDRSRHPPAVVPTPVPLAKISLLGTILLANNASIWMIFSFLPFMVGNFFPSLSTTELGFEAGILGSAFSCGGLIGNFVSGVISDRIGRRPALLWGLLGTAISSLCFGFSPTFWLAVTSRFMWGVLNGNIGVAKTYLAEISDDTNLSRGMAYFGVIGSIGRVIGPIIGGLLSYPAVTLPGVFAGTPFETFPFALPSMVISVNCLIMFVITYFWLPETLKKALYEPEDGSSRGRSTRREGLQYSALLSDEDSAPDAAADDSNGHGIELSSIEDDSSKANNTSNPLLGGSNSGNHFTPLKFEYKRMSGETDEESVTEDQNIPMKESASAASNISDVTEKTKRQSGGRKKGGGGGSSVPRNISFHSLVRVKTIDQPEISYQGLKQIGHDDRPLQGVIDIETGLGAEDDTSGTLSPLRPESETLQDSLILPSVRYSNGAEFFESEDASKKTLPLNLAYLMRQRHVVVSTTLYGLSSFVTIIGNEIFTLWVVTSRGDGGLNYNTQQIGVAVMVCGLLGTVLQLTLYPYATEKMGVLKVHRWGGLMLGLNSVFMPCISYISRDETITMMIVIAALTVQSVAATWYLVSTFVLISNSCYSHQLATVNGIGQTCASLGRLSGPYLGSVLFAWSETNGLNWPFNQFFVFYLLAVMAVFIYQYSLYLPKSIQRRKREPKFKTWEEADAHYRRELEASSSSSSDEDQAPPASELASELDLTSNGASGAIHSNSPASQNGSGHEDQTAGNQPGAIALHST